MILSQPDVGGEFAVLKNASQLGTDTANNFLSALAMQAIGYLLSPIASQIVNEPRISQIRRMDNTDIIADDYVR